jgi:sarcosine oxidase subunit gamma
MSEPRTALGAATTPGRVTVRAAPAQGMIAVRGDLSDRSLAGKLADAAGVAIPATRGVSRDGDSALLWMSPDEAMLLCPYAQAAERLAALDAALAGEHALCADVSDARQVFTLEGPGVREVLAKLSPADLRPAALPAGELRRTRLAQVSGAFWLSDETTAHVVCFRSVAGYVFDLLSTAAAPNAEVGVL